MFNASSSLLVVVTLVLSVSVTTLFVEVYLITLAEFACCFYVISEILMTSYLSLLLSPVVAVVVITAVLLLSLIVVVITAVPLLTEGILILCYFVSASIIDNFRVRRPGVTLLFPAAAVLL